jgi:hypothetical protein
MLSLNLDLSWSLQHRPISSSHKMRSSPHMKFQNGYQTLWAILCPKRSPKICLQLIAGSVQSVLHNAKARHLLLSPIHPLDILRASKPKVEQGNMANNPERSLWRHPCSSTQNLETWAIRNNILNCLNLSLWVNFLALFVAMILAMPMVEIRVN